MILDTPIGSFTAHFFFQPESSTREGGFWRRAVGATLHRGSACARDPQGPGDPGGCRADSAVHAEITNPKTRPFRRDAMRAAALAKAMGRLGLNREERTNLWASHFAQVAVLPRRCVAVITICPAGHKHRVEAIPFPGLTPATIAEATSNGVIPEKQAAAFGDFARMLNRCLEGKVLFPSDREFCGHVLQLEDMAIHRGLVGNLCGLPTVSSKHRYLYEVDLPKGGRQKRREAALARAQARAAAEPLIADQEARP